MPVRLSRRELLQGSLTGLLGTTLLPAFAQRPASAGNLRLFRRPAFAVPVPTPFTTSLELDLQGHRQLLRFYRQAGADAVLALASTGEMLSLSWPESLQLTRSASAVFGAPRTWASLSCGRSVAACVHGARDLRLAGSGLPVVIPGLLAGATVTEAGALERLLEVGRRAGGPLGLYEAITPFHRTLPSAHLAALARQGSYQLLKTTQGSPGQISGLMAEAPPGFPILEANTAELWAVLQAGASGVIDFCAACFPELLQHLCRHWAEPTQVQAVQRLCRWIGDTDSLLLGSLPFPSGVKAVLAARGLSILPLSRQTVADLTAEQEALVSDLVRQFRSLSNEMGITPLI
jgi:dihydrodipicolinate synthase/N-acetylneuraminate lyase